MFKDLDVFYDKKNQCYQVRTKSTSYVIEFEDESKSTLFEELVKRLKSGDRPVVEVAGELRNEYDEKDLIEVLATLNEYELIPYEQRSEIRSFTKKDDKPKDDSGSFSGQSEELPGCELRRVAVLGDGDLSIVIAKKLRQDDYQEVRHHTFDDFKPNDDTELNKLISEFDFFVVDASRWNPAFVDRFNRLALAQVKPWLFVGGIEEINIKVGPLFYGKETGCYNCLVKRLKSNNPHLDYFESYEHHLRETNRSSQPDRLPQESLYLEMAAALTAIEVGKYFTLWTVPTTWRSFVSLNAINYEVKKHSLLKIPFCKVCKPKLEFNPAPWLEPISLS